MIANVLLDVNEIIREHISAGPRTGPTGQNFYFLRNEIFDILSDIWLKLHICWIVKTLLFFLFELLILLFLSWYLITYNEYKTLNFRETELESLFPRSFSSTNQLSEGGLHPTGRVIIQFKFLILSLKII